nr:uncharacterized protein LOC113693027 [Coffea arabica]
MKSILATQLQHDDQKPINSVCYGCQKPILEEPTYKCSECNIFLHKTCAELPREMLHHPLHPNHPLKLLPNSPYPKDRRCLCDACRQPWNSFVYHCYRCNFDLDILCAFPQGKLEHPSHEHPLTLVQRIASFACDACGTKEEQQSYICTACTFWIHRSCALLPTINHRKPHQHPLSLAYCFPIEYCRYEIPCDISFKKIPFQNWVYYCGPCRYFVHLKCMTRDRILPQVFFIFFLSYRIIQVVQFNDYNIIENPLRGETPNLNISFCISRRGMHGPKGKEDEEDLVQLPTNYFVQEMRHILEKKQGLEIMRVPKKVQVSCCQHTLAIVDIQKLIKSRNIERITCNRCIEPVVSLCCHCTQCNYFVHLTCAQLPEELQHPSHEKHKLKLAFVSFVWGMIKCSACNLDYNGYLFKCDTCRLYTFDHDVKCALLPSTIDHKAHEHSLVQMYRGNGNRCNSCGNVVRSFLYACEPCGFYLDYECALLPESVNHRWDKYALPLSFPPFSDRPDEFYCEICKEEIHPRRWHYHCRECDQSFHPRCIPGLGVTRNCNFGRILEFGRHPHPLKLVCDGEYRSTCDSCHERMYGNRVFKCETCQFYICIKYVARVANSGKIAGPAKISE